ncbi:hypothetical protein PG39_02325 [Salmonella enterica subsp. diarizonae]|uniref:Uncharacterized protein n=1 Tax=Salmonella diarizonae TaxID=59204 RepID=A0A5U3CU28_SALDZ|nr:hypothetical protein [Salmonella enterica subsp. diarizonae]ECO1714553.1 hypothetical protein [Salmonella enterica]EBP3693208.1 hypothetical protein [Salmonella enterica subsp. diarizonae]EBQ6942473.1 hypothetical protein [Salmonella enterica subsp. diarizonae]ECO1820429.1 hypothetical protein [Salmonella enterica]
MTDVINLPINRDWDLTATERLLKEKKRLRISDGRMAAILGIHVYFYYLITNEKPDFKVYELSGRIQAALDDAGFDLFYVMTGEYNSGNYEIMLEAFDYAIADLPPDEQDDIRELTEPVYEKLISATSNGKRSMCR